MTKTEKGLAAAVERTCGGSAPVVEGAAQGSLPGIEAGEGRGPGRPPGQLNRSTREWVEYLNAKHGRSPLEELVAIGMRSPDEIVAELGCERKAALGIKVAALVAALPYMHQKLPISVDLKGAGPAMLVINMGEPAEAGDGDDAMVIEGAAVHVEKDGKSDG